MSTGPIGIVGSLATAQLQQSRAADSDRAGQEVSNQTRQSDAARKAENAAGVGEMEQESETSERDADGRRLWERQDHDAAPSNEEAKEIADMPRSRDPSGDAGNQLDLSG